tara:strand:+ start:100 stop:564 length:465 start_codon:yes stop_codon:yes gene_type:complete
MNELKMHPCKRAYLYRNLSKAKGAPAGERWSVRYDGRVTTPRGGASYLVGFCVEFRVGEKGRERVIKEGAKNVHAFAACYNVSEGMSPAHLVNGGVFTQEEIDNAVRITYDPYAAGDFLDPEGYPIGYAKAVFTTPKGMFAIEPGKTSGTPMTK